MDLLLFSILFFPIVGILAGLLSGFFGIGGGLILVPFLSTFFPYYGSSAAVDMHAAIGTSLALMMPTAIKGTYTHYQLGKAYYALERWQDSVSANISALEIDPQHSRSHYQLGMTYLKLDDKGSAFDEYKVLKKQDKNLANTLFDSIYQ